MDASDLVPIVCPTCATEFDVSRLPKGTKTACPKCRTIVVVPGASAPRPPVAVPPARVSPPPPSPLAPKRIEGSKKPPTNNVPVLAIVLAAVVFVGAGAGAFWFYGQQPRPVPQPASGPAPSRPASTVLPAARKNVALELRSRGWRQAPAFDVASALKHSLASAGVVVAASGSAPDARVVVEYEERRGASYTNGSTATVIEMQLDLEVGSARVLTLHGSGSSGGGPGSTEDSLYREALEAFQRSPGFVHGGSLVAGTLGVGDGSASIVDALLKRETRDLALDVLEKNGWQGSDARGRAALAAAR
ncbi:MAG: hypothetical protein JO332_17900, partial [Planctomycetaceae bacterium]|nr:hypothetical protein [Planctomycetaceae bacterium]